MTDTILSTSRSTKPRIHLIGIGGSGLSAIARFLLESGYTVSGSDRSLSPLAKELAAAGVRVSIGHQAENVQGADLVVRSSAVPDDNIEVLAAQAAGITGPEAGSVPGPHDGRKIRDRGSRHAWKNNNNRHDCLAAHLRR